MSSDQNLIVTVHTPRRDSYDAQLDPKEAFILPLLRNHIRGAISKHVQLADAEHRVLDVGCGEQPFRKELVAAGWAYTGMDMQQNCQQNVDVIGAIDAPLPQCISRHGFGLILCTEVLEHVANWEVAFQNLAELLAPGGRLVITCPHFFQLHEIPYDYWRPTLYGLRHYAQRHGLAVVEEYAAGDGWDVIGTALAQSTPLAGVGLAGRLTRIAVSVCFRAAVGLIRNGVIRRLVKLDSRLYLVNVIVLGREAE